jgi:AbrB family looped-hinge helix DNA binding protein
MKLSKVTSGGRITIPASLRQKYNLKPRSRVNLSAEKDGIKIVLLATPEEIKANAGFLGTKGKLLKALMEEKKREREI